MSRGPSTRSRGALPLVRRFTTLSVTAVSLATFAASHQRADAGAPVLLPSAAQDRGYVWTPHLAARFPGCEAHLPAGTVPGGFLVQRLDGSFERMAFDEAWRRTHDAQRADDVWVFGACR